MAANELRFSASFWPARTMVRMVNVPWDGAYKDVVQFDSAQDRDVWFDSIPYASMRTSNMSYIAPGQSIVLPCPVTTAEQYNYLYVSNPGYEITDEVDDFMGVPRRYFYFITDAVWLSPAACQVTLQLDVWTTWSPFCRFSRAFVAQGHAAIANTNLWSGRSLSEITPNKMRRYLSTPESVDVGGDYVPLFTNWTDLTIPTGGTQGTFIGIMSSVDLSQPWGTTTNPTIKTASGSVQEGMLAGVQVIYFKLEDFLALLDDLRDAPWVSRNIMQLWLAPGRMTSMASVGTIHGHTYYRPAANSPSEFVLYELDAMSKFEYFYTNHRTIAPKLLTSPYACIELNCFEGSPLILKPEQAASLSSMLIMGHGMVMAPWDRIAIYPQWYGAGGNPGDLQYQRQGIDGTIVTSNFHKGDNLDTALWITELPRFAFTSDGYLSWLASGAHSRAWSYQNNDWAYHKNTLQRELAYNQANESRDLAYRQDMQSRNLVDEQRLMRSIMTGAAGLEFTDPLGSIGRTAQTVANHMMDQTAADLSRSQAIESTRLAQQQADQNNVLAGYAMRGDYQQAMAALMASQRDAMITPPSVVGSAGGNGWNYAMGILGFRTTIKIPSDGRRRILFDYFSRFGYTINELIDMPRDLRLMNKFTYWKLQESFITGTVTETAKQALRGIFERGVTVWNSPEDIETFRYNGTSSNGINTSNAFSY